MKENPVHQISYTINYFFLFAALAIILPFFPLVLQTKGLSPSRIGFLLGFYEIFSILGLMILGRFFDRVQSPRRTIITIALACCGLIYLITRPVSLLSLVLLTLCLGFFIKSPSTMIDALYGQTMKNPNKSYGKARVGGSIGFFAAALTAQLTGWIDGGKPVSVFLGYSFCYLVFVGITMILPTDQIHRKTGENHEPFLKTIRSFPPIFWIGLSIAFLSALGLSGHYTFFSLMLENRFNRPDVGGFWAIGPLFELPLFFFSPYLLRKFSLKRLWLICLGAGIIRLQVYSLSNSLLPLYLVQVMHSFTFALNHLCMMTLITQTTSSSSRGLAMSIYTALGMGLPLFTGGVAGGLILHTGDFPLLYQIFSLFPLLGALICLIFLKGHREITNTV